MEFIDATHLCISDWVTFPVKGFGKLWIYDLEANEAQMVLCDESPADILYEQNTGKIYIPQMLHNRILITDLQQLKSTHATRYNHLYQYGVADAFMGGLYKGNMPVKELVLKGDFGLGAPDQLDGELLISNGQVFQTTVSGQTVVVADTFKTSLSFVTFFKADTVFSIHSAASMKEIFKRIEGYLPNANGAYAIRVKGSFESVRTRAFRPVTTNASPPLATMLNKQKFFDYVNTTGTLTGYKLPIYLAGINVNDFHFHFLSDSQSQGGHVLDFRGKDLHIEIAVIRQLELAIPQDSSFAHFNFQKVRKEDLQKVEKGH